MTPFLHQTSRGATQDGGMASAEQQTMNWSRQLSYSRVLGGKKKKPQPGGNGEEPSSRESNSMIARSEAIYETINQIREAILLRPQMRSQHQKTSKVRESNGEVVSGSSQPQEDAEICKHTPVFLPSVPTRRSHSRCSLTPSPPVHF